MINPHPYWVSPKDWADSGMSYMRPNGRVKNKLQLTSYMLIEDVWDYVDRAEDSKALWCIVAASYLNRWE